MFAGKPKNMAVSTPQTARLSHQLEAFISAELSKSPTWSAHFDQLSPRCPRFPVWEVVRFVSSAYGFLKLKLWLTERPTCSRYRLLPSTKAQQQKVDKGPVSVENFEEKMTGQVCRWCHIAWKWLWVLPDNCFWLFIHHLKQLERPPPLDLSECSPAWVSVTVMG